MDKFVNKYFEGFWQGHYSGVCDAAKILRRHFTKPNGMWTSAKAKACYDDLQAMMQAEKNGKERD